jgi:NAD(P)-dependent dehydrogenase (short-subunit alcohol dehydrogenase family)
MSLAGRAALVTGGGSGIGRAIALRLARDGADVVVLDRDLPAATQVAAECRAVGRRAEAVHADVADGASVGAALGAAHAAVGPVRVLVNAAGISGFALLVDMTDAQWDGMIAVHLRGTFLCCRAALPDMLAAGGGRIVNISSVGGLRGGPMLTHYAAAKAGVIGFTKALAIEVGGRGITVNAIAPGLVDTPMLRASGLSDAVKEQSLRQTPVGRLGTPDDIAAACAYLVSDEAAWFTGQVLSPNGGAHL